MTNVTIHIEADSSAQAQLEMERLLAGLPRQSVPGPPLDAVADAGDAARGGPEPAPAPKKRGRPRKADKAPEQQPEPAAELVKDATQTVELKDVQDAVKAVVEAFDDDEGTEKAIAMLAEFDCKTARMAHEKGVGAEVIVRAAEIVAGAA